MIGLSYTAAFFLVLVYTIDSQPTDKMEGVGDDFVRGGRDKTPTQKKHSSSERTPLCTSAESFFSWCNSVAALALANCSEHVAEENMNTASKLKNITAPADGFPTNRHTRTCVRGGTGYGRSRACGG